MLTYDQANALLLQKLRSKITYLDLVCNTKKNGKIINELRALSKLEGVDDEIVYDAIKRIEHQASIINVVKDIISLHHQNTQHEVPVKQVVQ